MRMDDGRLKQLAASVSLTLAVLLALLKIAGAIATGSLALLTSLIDSLADIIASGITFVSVRISRQPPDESHRFGHGKAESVSAFAQAALVAGSALFILVEAVGRSLEPTTIARTGLGLAIMGFAILATLALVVFQRHVVARTGSQAIAADSLHYRGDLAINASVVLSLWLATVDGWSWADPVIAAAIALYLMTHALLIGRDAVDVLMDHELSTDQRQRIETIITSHPDVAGMHDLRTREAGPTIFIECHIEMDGHLSLNAVHDIVDGIEHDLTRAFTDAEIIIHQEPAGIVDDRLDHVVHGERREASEQR